MEFDTNDALVVLSHRSRKRNFSEMLIFNSVKQWSVRARPHASYYYLSLVVNYAGFLWRNVHFCFSFLGGGMPIEMLCLDVADVATSLGSISSSGTWQTNMGAAGPYVQILFST